MQHNTATSRVKLLWRQCVVLGLGLARDELFLHDAARSYELIKKIAWERDTGRIDWLIRHCGRMSACPACLQAAWTNPISHRCPAALGAEGGVRLLPNDWRGARGR